MKEVSIVHLFVHARIVHTSFIRAKAVRYAVTSQMSFSSRDEVHLYSHRVPMNILADSNTPFLVRTAANQKCDSAGFLVKLSKPNNFFSKTLFLVW